MPLVFVVVILIDLVIHASNARKKEQQIKANSLKGSGPRAQEQLLSVWITLYHYALIDPKHHKDSPYDDAIWAVENKINKPEFISVKDEVMILPSLADVISAKKASHLSTVPNLWQFTQARTYDHIEWVNKYGSGVSSQESALYDMEMEKRYNEVAELYSKWMKDHPIETLPQWHRDLLLKNQIILWDNIYYYNVPKQSDFGSVEYRASVSQKNLYEIASVARANEILEWVPEEARL